MHLVILLYGGLVVVVGRALYALINAATASTRDIPGPFLARFTKLYYFHMVWTGQAHHQNLALHKKYAKKGEDLAPIVRLGPSLFSIVEPDKQIYGIGSKMAKSDWYEGWKHPHPDRWTLFPDRNIARHAETRKKFSALYAMSSLKSYEKYVDNCIELFDKKLNDLSDEGKAIDMYWWFQCFAFDVVGDITYSKRVGFLDEGKDIDGIAKAVDSQMVYGTLVGIFSQVHPYLYEVMQRIPGSGAAGRQKLMGWVAGNKAKREEERKAQDLEGKSTAVDEELPEDFLDKLLNMKEDDVKGVTDYHCFMMGLSNILAGSDTTAISLSTTLYHLIRTPRVMRKLREELQQKREEDPSVSKHFTFEAASGLPYFQACLKEALRMHAAVGLPLWRRVNAGGARIAGHVLPAGSDVGVNSWVAHFNKDVWGADAYKFRPERWLEGDTDQLRLLDQSYLVFGLGSRTCIGRHISYLEMTKLIPFLVQTFDFELCDSKPWSDRNFWFVKPVNFHVRITRRKQ